MFPVERSTPGPGAGLLIADPLGPGRVSGMHRFARVARFGWRRLRGFAGADGIPIAHVARLAATIDPADHTLPSPGAGLAGVLRRPERNPFVNWSPTRVPVRHWRLRDVVLDGTTLALFARGARIRETCYLHTPEMLAGLHIHKAQPTPATDATPVVIGGSAVSRSNYYHWLAQALPAIDSALRRHDGANVRLALPALLPWQRDGIAMLGYDQLPRLDVEPGRQIRLRQAEYSELLSGHSAFNVSPGIAACYAALRQRVPLRQAPDARIYVARIDTPQRPMRSEDRLIERLIRRGFRIVVPSTLAFAEQAALFRQARLVVGPHGAGLTNLIFAPAGALVYELVPQAYDNPCFRVLADNCGLLHWADAFPSEGDAAPLVRPWKVDVNAVEARLDELEALLDAADPLG